MSPLTTSTDIAIPALYVALAATAAQSVVVLLAVIKPLLELLPRLGPRDAAHDPVIRLLSLVLNLAAVLGLAAAFGVYRTGNIGIAIALLLIQTLSQNGFSEFTYRAIASTAGDTATPSAPVVPPLVVSPVPSTSAGK